MQYPQTPKRDTFYQVNEFIQENYLKVASMTYDREEDILYLAHRLWEEADAPMSAAPAYWKEAALQVLARGGKHVQAHRAVVDFNRRKTNDIVSPSSLRLTREKHGRAICVDANGQRRVTFALENKQAVVANCSLADLVRKVD